MGLIEEAIALENHCDRKNSQVTATKTSTAGQVAPGNNHVVIRPKYQDLIAAVR